MRRGQRIPGLASNGKQPKKESAMTELRRFPTPEEIHAIEQAARQARAEAIARMVFAAARGLKTLIVRGATALAGKARRTAAPARHVTLRT